MYSTFIDLFCGLGGFRIALQRHGLSCVFSSDIDKHIQENYCANFKDTPLGDITKLSEKSIPPHDVLCAGFPCQSFSISGKQAGLNSGVGRLFYEIVRIVKYHKPKLLLLENVPNIISIDNGKVLKTIYKSLGCCGYIVNHKILNSSHYGIPQSRKRVYFIARRSSDTVEPICFPAPNYKPIYLDNILEKSVSSDLSVSREDMVLNIKSQSTKYALAPIRIGIVNKGGQGERIYSTTGHAITLSASGGGVGARTGLYLVDDVVRRLSIIESKRVMGFSDTHTVSSGLLGYKELGNAVIPEMISLIYTNLMKDQNAIK
jgi:DNA (cytosine-5)-methyltransferase 1